MTVPAEPKNDTVSKDYFRQWRDTFRNNLAEGTTLSASLSGRFVSTSKGWAQWLHLRMCIAGDSLLTIAEFEARRDHGRVCTLDHSSLASIARGLAESAAMLAYISNEALNEDQIELRKHVLWLHDATTRYKMFSAWNSKDQAEGFKSHMQDLRLKVEASETYKALSPERQKRITSGSEMYVDGLRSAVRLMDWDIEDFNATYAYLSCHAHSSPVSFIRLLEHGIDFQEPTDAQYGIAGFALEVGAKTMRYATKRIEILFEAN